MKLVVTFALAAITLFAKVDINNADAETLQTLSNVGPKTAEKIIEYRKEHCFKKAEELISVKGIGQKTLEKNLEEIEVGPCPKK